jgi:hypothetical protein
LWQRCRRARAQSAAESMQSEKQSQSIHVIVQQWALNLSYLAGSPYLVEWVGDKGHRSCVP